MLRWTCWARKIRSPNGTSSSASTARGPSAGPSGRGLGVLFCGGIMVAGSLRKIPPGRGLECSGSVNPCQICLQVFCLSCPGCCHRRALVRRADGRWLLCRQSCHGRQHRSICAAPGSAAEVCGRRLNRNADRVVAALATPFSRRLRSLKYHRGSLCASAAAALADAAPVSSIW